MESDSKKAELNENERMSLSATQRHAREAYSALIARVSVMIFPKGFGPIGTVGSGVLLATAAGTPFLLTARHMFDECSDFKNLHFVNEKAQLTHVAERVFPGPQRPGTRDERHEFIDIAAVALVQSVREKVRSLAGATLAFDSETTHQDVVIVAGYPAFLSNFERVGEKRIDVDVGRLVYVTGVNGRDDFGRLRVEWHEAKAIWDTPYIAHFPIPAGETFELGRPQGVSGGGLWRVRGPVDKEEIWAPSSHCQLIGIPVAVLGKTEFVEPVELWRDWLTEVTKEIDSQANS